jgi:hypothetical protein
MAEPARKLPPEDRPDIRPRLGVIEGGGEGDSTPRGNLRAVDNTALQNAEGGGLYNPEGDSRARSSSDLKAGEENPEQNGRGLASDEFDGDTAGGPGKKKKGRFQVTRRRAATGAVILSLLGVGGFGLEIAQGPLQIIHLSEILQRFSGSQDEANETRLGALMRYARTGHIGETRVGYFGSRSVAKTTAKLEKIGVRTTEVTVGGGRPTKIEIDTEKFGSTPEDTARAFRQAGVPEENISIKGNKVTIGSPDGKPMPDNVARDAKRVTIAKANEGKRLGRITTAVEMRPVAKYDGISWHLMEKLKTRAGEKVAGRGEVKTREVKHTERTPEAEERAKGIRSKLSPKAQVAGAIGIGQLGICLARDIAGEVPLLEYSEVVKPSQDLAADSVTYGAQTKSGSDFTATQAGEVSDSLHDNKGHSVWNNKALNALAYGGAGEGVDMSSEYKSAFSQENSGAKAKEVIDQYGGSFLCSWAGVAATTAAGLAALVLTPETGGASEAVYQAVKVGASAAATMAAVQLLMKYIPELVADTPSMKPIVQDVQQKGGALAFGSASLFNNSYVKSGGAVINDSLTSDTVAMYADKQDRQDLESKTYFARIYDARDYRSLTGRLVDSINPSPSANLASLVGNVANFGGIFSKTLSAFVPAVRADEKPYDFMVPQVGFTDAQLNSPELQDPYDNADKAAQLLDTNSSYIDRAKTCFGVDINRDSKGLWQVKVTDTDGGDPGKEVLLNSSKYHDANCAENNLDWLRIRMFIFDSRAMTAYSCYDGDDEACKDLDIESDNTSSPTDTSSNANSGKIIGDPLSSSVDVACPNPTKDVGVHDAYSQGKAIKMRLCSIPNLPCENAECNGGGGIDGADGHAIITSRAAGAVYAMVEAANKDGVHMVASSTFRTMANQQSLCPCDGISVARPGYSAHQAGAAIDFELGSSGVKNGSQSCDTRARSPGNPTYDWLVGHAAQYGYKQYSAESWHWDPLDMSNRCSGS